MARIDKENLWQRALVLAELDKQYVANNMGTEQIALEHREELIQVLKTLVQEYELMMPDYQTFMMTE